MKLVTITRNNLIHKKLNYVQGKVLLKVISIISIEDYILEIQENRRYKGINEI